MSSVDVTRPPITTTASGWAMKPPSPVTPRAIGSRAKIVARAVIRIGRSRCRPPSRTASTTPYPWARYWLIRSISTIALVTTMPISISMPIIAGTPIGVPVATRRPIAPVAANGMDTSRISGWTSERKVATSSMNTMATAASIARNRLVNASSWSAVTPPISAVAPAGSFSASSFFVRSALTAPVLSPVGFAVIVAARWPSIRVIDTGPSTSSTVATSLSRASGPTGSLFSSSSVRAGFADTTTTSRSVSPRTALPPVVPRTAWATSAPSFWSSSPAAAAAGLAFTEIRGTDCARSLVTSVTSSRPATVSRTSSAALRSTSASAALTTTLRSWLPKPSPPATVVSPIPESLPSPFSIASSTSAYEAESAILTEYDAWLVPEPPPKAAMKPEEPTVTW